MNGKNIISAEYNHPWENEKQVLRIFKTRKKYTLISAKGEFPIISYEVIDSTIILYTLNDEGIVYITSNGLDFMGNDWVYTINFLDLLAIQNFLKW